MASALISRLISGRHDASHSVGLVRRQVGYTCKCATTCATRDERLLLEKHLVSQEKLTLL